MPLKRGGAFGPPARFHVLQKRMHWTCSDFMGGVAPLQKADHPFGQCVAVVLNCTLSQYLQVVRSFPGELLVLRCVASLSWWLTARLMVEG